MLKKSTLARVFPRVPVCEQDSCLDMPAVFRLPTDALLRILYRCVRMNL
jgi:hypothetical protein